MSRAAELANGLRLLGANKFAEPPHETLWGRSALVYTHAETLRDAAVELERLDKIDNGSTDGLFFCRRCGVASDNDEQASAAEVATRRGGIERALAGNT